MKTKTVLLIFLTVLLLPLLGAGRAEAGYSYYIPDIYGATSPYPELEHFDWINRVYYYETVGSTATYDGTYTATNTTFQIEVRMYAPDNWGSSETTATGTADYTTGTYQEANDAQHVNETWVGTPAPNQTFNNVYSYFYQVTNVGDGAGAAAPAITSLAIPYNPADVKGYGYVNDGDGVDPNSIGSNINNTELVLTFGGIAEGSSSEWFFMTSESWWGWQPLSYNGGLATGSTQMASWTSHYSPSGGIPAPNPEASTVALYVVGLMGMAGYTYMKKRRAEIL